MKHFLAGIVSFITAGVSMLPTPGIAVQTNPPPRTVYVIPIRDDIMPPLVYVVRRGVKEAMAAKADAIVLDMDTNGGRVDTTEEIIEVINQFKGEKISYVNRKAFSAGAFICFATKKIFMSPQSVIGAAAPIVLSPGGDGVEKLPESYEAKMVSAVSALVRANAEKNGHNVEVADAMVKRDKELIIDGETINAKGQILTLTDAEARKTYGKPARSLLSAGTVESLDELLKQVGGGGKTVFIKPTGAEKLGTWLNAIGPLLLIIGIVGIYIEIKTPGFGVPGIIALVAFTLYFLGGYIAGLSGIEWIAVFILGLMLVVFELFIHPGLVIPGLLGFALMLVALIMAMADIYPGGPPLPTLPQLRLPIQDLTIAFAGSLVLIAVLAKFLPKTSVYRVLVSESASGVRSMAAMQKELTSQVGQVGVAISPLRPAGKAQFGEQILDVISQGEMVGKGQKVRVIGHSGREAIVEVVV